MEEHIQQSSLQKMGYQGREKVAGTRNLGGEKGSGRKES